MRYFYNDQPLWRRVLIRVFGAIARDPADARYYQFRGHLYWVGL